jgi:hypothetical protein
MKEGSRGGPMSFTLAPGLHDRSLSRSLEVGTKLAQALKRSAYWRRRSAEATVANWIARGR